MQPNIQIEVTAAGCVETLPSGSKRNFPVGWTGFVPYELALEFVTAEKAIALSVEGDDEFSPEEFAVLKGAAREILNGEPPAPIAPAADDSQAEQPEQQPAGDSQVEQPVEPEKPAEIEQPRPAAAGKNKGGRK